MIDTRTVTLSVGDIDDIVIALRDMADNADKVETWKGISKEQARFIWRKLADKLERVNAEG